MCYEIQRKQLRPAFRARDNVAASSDQTSAMWNRHSLFFGGPFGRLVARLPSKMAAKMSGNSPALDYFLFGLCFRCGLFPGAVGGVIT